MATNSAWNPRRCRSAWALAAFGLLLTAASGVEIYPSAETLPANHLKFYLHFAEPMQTGVFLEHCRLLDEQGETVPEPFRETELWSDNSRRLTLWLHPGRQKTGVNLNDEFGPVLEPHRRYTLVISGQWPTERGEPLGREVRKSFVTGGRAEQQLDPTSWNLRIPQVGTRDVLEVRFPAPLDHALLHRCLRVADAAGKPVPGRGETADQERQWRFKPEQPWRQQEHRILVEAVLEDLAGNSLARPFEVDLQAPSPKAVPSIIPMPFTPIR